MSKEVSNTADTEQADHPAKPPKRGRWLSRLIWCVVILGILGFFVNGIVARKLAHHFLNKSLEAQGMNGSVEIKGSILSGFELNNLHYKGTEGIQILSADNISLDYQIIELIDLKVDKLSVTSLNAEIDIAKFKPSENTESAPTDWKETLKKIRPLVMHPKISIEDLNITVLNDSKKILHWKLGSLQHDASTDEIQLTRWLISDDSNHITPEQSSTLVWQQGTLISDRLELLPELALEAVHLDWTSELKGKASVEYHDSSIDANIAANTTLKHSKGTIRTEDVLKTLSTFSINTDDLDIEAVLNNLEITIPTEDLKKTIPQWNLDASIGIQSARWATHRIKNTTLDLNQNQLDYKLKLEATALNAPLKLDVKGKWESPDANNWWESTTAEANFKTKLNDQILGLITQLIPQFNTIPSELKLNNSTLAGKVSAKLTDAKLINASGKIDFSEVRVRQELIPTITANLNLTADDLQFNLQPKEKPAFKFAGEFNSNKQTYAASFQAKTRLVDSPWINTLAEVVGSPFMFNNQLDIDWQGDGNLTSNNHKGTLITTDLEIAQQGIAPAKFNINAGYDWPRSIDLKKLQVEQAELSANSSLHWDGKTITIHNSEINRHGERIASITGNLPYSTDINTSEKFFAQTSPWDIRFNTEPLLLKRISETLPLSDELNLTGTFQTKLAINGSPIQPVVNGFMNVEDLSDVLELGLDKISINTKLATENETLNIKGNMLEVGKQLVTIDLDLPFTPHQWLRDDNLLETIQNNSEIKGTAEVMQFPLSRLTKKIPDLEKLKGTLDVRADFQGTIAEPKYKVSFNADVPIISVKGASVGDIRNVKIKGKIDQTMILDAELAAKINGGNFSIKSKVDTSDPSDPIFDVKLITNHALIYRDDVVHTRANAHITLKGKVSDATITGDIGIIESLFYKDIDLIPIGVPTGSVGTVSLPSLDTRAKESLPIPAPFDQWKLDLNVNTEDPILIRGNIGTGKIEGTVKVRGTLSKPSLDGTLRANDVKAKLPFSILAIHSGKIIFKPNRGFIPELEIKGKSQVGIHNVTLFAYGSADDPKLTLSSYPVLPENEIMTLLATGTTNAGLEDRDVATFKTLQLLLQELKQHSDRPGGNKMFSKVLSGIEDLDLKVGEVNDLTGEKYASATFKLHRRWFLTAQIDDNQPPQSRGLVIFALRFR